MACESQVPPIEGVGGTAWSPISKAKICLSDGAAGFKGLTPNSRAPAGKGRGKRKVPRDQRVGAANTSCHSDAGDAGNTPPAARHN